jgi:non-specific serine/threonine protein kinase
MMELHAFSFAEFRVDGIEQTVWRGTDRLCLTPKSTAILQHLARNAGRVVTKEELLDAIWPATHVVAAVVKRHVSEIRQALGDSSDAPRFIETIGHRGYRFVASVRSSNVPIPLTSFVGRQRELGEVKRLLEGGRLLTLTGPCGVGKTRLALEAVSDLPLGMPYAVFWVDFAPLSDASQIAPTVARVLGIHDRADASVQDSLIAACGDRFVLLVFDNCEHLIDGCASLAGALVRSCRNLKLLATSRQPLGVAGERVSAVPPLSTPQLIAHGNLLGFDAIRLFVERANAVSPSSVLSDRTASAIVRICRRLDGLPLAIELIAARCAVLPPAQIASHLDDVFTLAGTGNRAELPRHQTLRAAFEWSYNLLSGPERLLFARLSVFAGSFALAAVESVCADDALDRRQLFDLLGRLVDHSLVSILEGPTAEPRYRLLRIVRHYASEKLQRDCRSELARRHAEFFLAIAEENERGIYTGSGVASLARLRREYPNISAALEWCRDHAEAHELGLRLATALRQFWAWRGDFTTGRDWLEKMLERSSEAPVELKAGALYAVAALAQGLSDFQYARDRVEQSVALCRAIRDVTGLGRALERLGSLMLATGELADAEQVLDEAIELLRSTGSAWYLGLALMQRGRLMADRQRVDAAAAAFEESAAILRAIPDSWLLSHALYEMAQLEWNQCHYDRAEACFHESLALLQQHSDRWVGIPAVIGMASLACARRDYARAARLCGAAASMRERVEDLHRLRAVRTEWTRLADELRTSLGEAEYAALVAEGQQLSRDETIALALAGSQNSVLSDRKESRDAPASQDSGFAAAVGGGGNSDGRLGTVRASRRRRSNPPRIR